MLDLDLACYAPAKGTRPLQTTCLTMARYAPVMGIGQIHGVSHHMLACFPRA